MKHVPLFALMALVSLPLARTTAQGTDGTEAVALKNPGFEEPYAGVPPAAPDKKAKLTGVIADGWNDNSDWADVAVEYASDTTKPQEGGAAMKVMVSEINSGAVQFSQKVQFTAGHDYAFKVWMKAEQPGTQVTLLLRKIEEPWTTFATTTATLTDEWQEFTVSGNVPEDTTGFLMMVVNRPMVFWIDDAKFEDLTKSTAPR